MRQLHLRLGVGGLCAHGEDVEDEGCAVEDFHLQLVLDVAYLLCRELIVEYHHTDFSLGVFLVEYILLYLLELSLAHICGLVGAVHSLCESLHGDGAGGVGKEFQFVEILLGLGLVLFLRDESHEYGGFGLDF